jgi:dUTP pyrophosphatase
MASVISRPRTSTLPSAILHKLSKLQGALNSFIDKNWVQNRDPDDWGLAITLESAELIDSYPWKWWKSVNKPADIGNVKVELVDILHFSLSGTMQLHANPSNNKNGNGVSSEDQLKAWGLNPTIVAPLMNTQNAIKTFRNVIGLAKFHKFDIITEQIIASAEDLGFNLVAYYVAKHTLNVIRQLGGYKDGSYVKVSNVSGKEDNELLHDVISGVSFEAATGEDTHEGVWNKIMGGVYEVFQVPEKDRKQTKDWIGA